MKKQTLVLVTHNPEISEYSTRIVRVRDGKIEKLRMEGIMVMKQRMLKKMLNLGLTLIFVLTAMLSLLPPDVAAARDADTSLTLMYTSPLY